MATQILRTIDRWRFETPLALVLAAAAGFAAMAMPHDTFARLPLAGRMGTPGHVVLALLLAIVCGVAGYVAMRRPAKVVPIDEDAEPIDELDVPSGMAEDRLRRLRRADRHPDAPPRAPIRASRDLGEPFMDVGAVVPSPAEDDIHADADAAPVEDVAAESAILDGDYVEVEAPVVAPVEAVACDPVANEPQTAPASEAEPAPIPEIAPVIHALGEPFLAQPIVAAPRQDASITAMMERLSAGIERRSGRPAAPTRDMRPALRDALDELNRLAARRG